MGERYGWRLVFTLLGISGVIYTGFCLFALRRSDSQTPSKSSTSVRFGRSMRELLSLPGFIQMAVVFCAFSIANWMVYTWLPLYLYERFHMSLTTAGFSATFYIQIACVIGAIIAGRLADLWSRTTSRGRILTQVIGICVAAPCLFFVGYTASPNLLIGGLVLFGLAKGFYDCNVMPVLCQIARPELRATGFGVFNFAASGTAGFTAAAAGALKSVIGLEGSMMIAGALLFVSAILLIRIPVEKDT